MKVPLRFQITEFDCGPVSLLNAFSYLFSLEEIPAEIVKTIYQYTLDCYDEYGNVGHGGTSREAISKFVCWITDYIDLHHFNVRCDYLEKEEVTLKKIVNCLELGGVCFVRTWLKNEHYIIVTKIKGNDVYIFDPYYLDFNKYSDSQVKIILNKPFTHNRKVSLKRFLSETEKDFSLGKICGRQCVLIYRT